MATVQSPLDSPPARRSTAPTGPKLRDSCQGCAVSKLKCSKDKPACARCAKRGMVCEYFATKRAGRKMTTRLNNNVPTAARPLESSASRTPSWSTGIGPDLMPSPLTQAPLQDHSSSYSDTLSSLFSTDLPASTLSPLTTPFPSFLASPVSFAFLDLPDIDGLGDPSILDSSDTTSLFLPENPSSTLHSVLAEHPPFSGPQTPPESRGSTTSGHSIHQDSVCCLTRSLGLLKQLFPNASMACGTTGRIPEDSQISHTPTIESVIAENEQVIRAITEMLSCPCSQNPYFLMIISLVVFKVLGWYAAAARQTPTPNNSENNIGMDHGPGFSEQVFKPPGIVGSYDMDGEDQGRMAAQLVLGELHRVQRLINELSHLLEAKKTRPERLDTPRSMTEDSQDFLSSKETLPFPVTMLDQLEIDLRKHLRALSGDIVSMLRQQ